MINANNWVTVEAKTIYIITYQRQLNASAHKCFSTQQRNSSIFSSNQLNINRRSCCFINKLSTTETYFHIDIESNIVVILSDIDDAFPHVPNGFEGKMLPIFREEVKVPTVTGMELVLQLNNTMPVAVTGLMFLLTKDCEFEFNSISLQTVCDLLR